MQAPQTTVLGIFGVRGVYTGTPKDRESAVIDNKMTIFEKFQQFYLWQTKR